MRTNDTRPRGAWRRGMVLFALMLPGCSQEQLDEFLRRILPGFENEERVTAPAEEPPAPPPTAV